MLTPLNYKSKDTIYLITDASAMRALVYVVLFSSLLPACGFPKLATFGRKMRLNDVVFFFINRIDSL